jgi:hypothetical protein
MCSPQNKTFILIGLDATVLRVLYTNVEDEGGKVGLGIINSMVDHADCGSVDRL